MARRIPKLCRHKSSGQAYVTDPATKREVYLGRYGSAEADAAYDQWVREFLARAASRVAPGARLSVEQLLDAFLEHADGYYRKRGKVTSEVRNFEAAALAVQSAGLGKLPAAGFGPLQLKAVQSALAARKLARSTVNSYIRRVVQIWRWGVAEGVIAADVLTALEAVPGLRRGRTLARETDRVKPADVAAIETVLPHLPELVRAALLVQWHGAMRASEALHIRPCDLDRSVIPWRYTVTEDWNKAGHKGVTRAIYLGPKARAVLIPWLERCAGPTAWAFPGRRQGQPHSESGYRNAVAAGCRRAGVAHFHPHQLRHTQATAVRARHGIDAAQGVLGHANLSTTEIYAEKDDEAARRAAEDLG